MLRALLTRLAWLACLACLLVAAPALGDTGDDRRDAEALYQLGAAAEAALDFPLAIAHYEECATRLPSSPFAPRASRRARELLAHAEGGFAPLVRLETVRRSPALSNDPAAIDALVRDAEAFPPGPVRVEARMFAAEAYLGRLGQKDDALPLFRLVADDPAADILTARDAASQLLGAYTGTRDYGGALSVADRYERLLPPKTKKDLLRLLRRRPLRYLAWGDLAVLAVFAAGALAGAHRARVLEAIGRLAPMAVVFAVVACGVSGFLASRYEQSNPYPFTSILPAMFVVILLARAWSAAGREGGAARGLRATIAFVGVFGAAFLLLDRMDPVYLSGFGL